MTHCTSRSLFIIAILILLLLLLWKVQLLDCNKGRKATFFSWFSKEDNPSEFVHLLWVKKQQLVLDCLMQRIFTGFALIDLDGEATDSHFFLFLRFTLSNLHTHGTLLVIWWLVLVLHHSPLCLWLPWLWTDCVFHWSAAYTWIERFIRFHVFSCHRIRLIRFIKLIQVTIYEILVWFFILVLAPNNIVGSLLLLI